MSKLVNPTSIISTCEICGSEKRKLTVIFDNRFTSRDDAEICNDCFNLWAAGKDSEIYSKIYLKLFGNSRTKKDE